MSLYFEFGHAEGKRTGSIEVICGSMFSGKTEELIRRLKRTKIAGQRVLIFKHNVDIRYAEDEVISHDANTIASIRVENSSDIFQYVDNVNVVAIDEAQFFDEGLVDVCNAFANKGIRVIIAGLDMDFKGRPFGPIPALMSIADDVLKVHAICVSCGRPAQFSHRLTQNQDTVLVGELKEYEPLCRSCFLKTNKL